jgi:rubrerythrin
MINDMVRRFDQPDLSRLGDDKALAIAAFGQSVAAYRYMVLAEKAADPRLRAGLQEMAARENTRRTQLQSLQEKLFSSACFFLDSHEKNMVCVGPRILDARDQTHFDEALKLLIASEKRIAGFYARYAAQAGRLEIKEIFSAFADESLQRVSLLRRMGQDIGRQINEPCPLQFLRPAADHHK